MAGVWIFSPPRFLVEEPRGDERQRLVVMPPDPVADLIVTQARVALATVEAFFDAMFRLGHASELAEGRGGVSVREVVIVFECPIQLTFAGDEQHLVGACAAGRCAGLNAAVRDLDFQRSLLAIAHVELGPRRLGQRPAPAIDALPRRLRMAAAARVLGRRILGIAEQRVRRNRQQLAQV